MRMLDSKVSYNHELRFVVPTFQGRMNLFMFASQNGDWLWFDPRTCSPVFRPGCYLDAGGSEFYEGKAAVLYH
jgi:hypothetical protein